MQILRLVTLLAISGAFSFAPSFEGKIVYKNAYISKMPNVNSEQLSAMMGTIQEYFIKGGNYKSLANGSYFQWQLYNNKENKLYSKFANTPAVYWNDGAVSPDEVIKAEVNKSAVTVLGHKCDELVLTCKSGVQKYYFDAGIASDAALFAGHKFGNWDVVMARTKAVPLKMVIDSQQFSVEITATEITAMKLDDSQFYLPADTKLEKSPF